MKARRVALSDVIVDARSGFACGARAPNGIVQVRMNNVAPDGSWDWSAVTRIPVDPQFAAPYLLQPGDVLFNNTNSVELVGKSAIFAGFQEPIVFSNHFTRLRTSPELDPSYLGHWLVGQWQAGVFARLCDRWVGQAAIRADKLLTLRLPLPTLPEQRRLAARLTDQLAAVRLARDAAAAKRGTCERLATTTLSSFSTSLLASWPSEPLGGLTQMRPSPSATSDGDAKIVAVTSACLGPMGFNSSGLRPNRMPTAAAALGTIERGEVLVARSNTEAYVGRAAVYDGDPPGITATDLVFRFVVRPDRLDAEYLARFLAGLQMTGYWRDRSSGASSTMKKITRAQLCSLPIPVAPIAMQRQVLGDVRARLAAIDAMARAIEVELEAAQALPAVLLRQAFDDVVA